MHKILMKFDDYSHSLVHSDYVLIELDKFVLSGFKEYYEEKYDNHL